MKVAYLVLGVDAMGGTERTVVNQATALLDLDRADLQVEVVSVLRTADAPHVAVDPRLRLRHLLDVRDRSAPVVAVGATPPGAADLLERPSLLVPPAWDGQFSALADVALEQALPGLDADVVVTVTPGLLAAAVRLLPSRTAVVHQEHRPSAQRTHGLEPLLVCGPQADLLAVLTQDSADWLAERLGSSAPPLAVVPNPLPPGPTPVSRLDSRLVVTGGRLQGEKQWGKLVDAFALVADDLPGWRLRLLGDGPQRPQLQRLVRRHDLWDRVELPGAVTDVASEWGGAAICALTSRNEALPLTLQEAMAAGVPCVSFDTCTGPRDLVEHEVTGLLVTQESVVGMAVALRRLALDDELRRRLGRAARAAVLEAYDAARIAARWHELLTRVVAGRAGRDRFAALATRPPPAGRAAASAGEPRPSRPREQTAARPDAGVTPAAARTAALTLAVRCAASTGEQWLVVPPHETGVPVVVLPMASRDSFLAALAAAPTAPTPPTAGGAPYLSVRDPARGGWPERRGTPAALAADLRRGRTPLLALEPWPTRPDGTTSHLGRGCSVEVEFWEEGLDGRLVAPRLDRYTQRLPADLRAGAVEVEVEGVRVPTLPLLAAPTVGEVRFPVDVVVTWVDGADPAWAAARESRLAGTGAAERARESSGTARYVSRDELRWCLRSVHLHAPWVRRIHLVTAGQVPAWLDVDHPAVHLVDHRDVLPPDALPTFNSHAIEAALHLVPDLAEHFVYLNDDFLLARPLRPEAFFSPAGATAVQLGRQPIGLDDAPDAPPYARAAWRNRRLVQEAFGVTTTHHLAHAPYAHRRSVLAEVEARFPEAVAATRRSPFRSGDDVSLLSSLAQHVGLVTGTAYVGHLAAGYVNLAAADVTRQLAGLLDRTDDVVCLADHHDHALAEDRLRVVLADALDELLPVAAPWERDAGRGR